MTGVSLEEHTTVIAEQRMIAWRAGPPGTPPSVVCVHGAGISSRPLLPLVRRLGERVESWAVDLPGFGRSSKPGDPPILPALSDALAGWLTALDLPPACLLGCSFGCQVAADVAVRHPEMVRALVLVGPTIDPKARTWPRTVARWLRNAAHESPRMVPLNLADYRDCGPRRALASWQESLRDRIEDRLPAITVPTLVVRGERDALVPQSWAEEVTRLIPRARLATVTGSPHMIPFKAPEALEGLVTDFLREITHATR
jgi:pimeloyl-ACP methyl ester carboxylesterase